jgi:ribonuclease-3
MAAIKRKQQAEIMTSIVNNSNVLIERTHLCELLGEDIFALLDDDIELFRHAMRNKSYCLSTYVSNVGEYAVTPCEADAKAVPLQDSESNERMEFLGDAVLGLIVAEYLYIRYPKEREGFMTQMRSNLVSGSMLARIGRIIGIQRFVLLSRTMEGQRDSKDVVEDTFEAFVAAVFMKLGLETTKRWFFKLVEDNLDFAQIVSDSYRDILIRYYKENFNRSLRFAWWKVTGPRGEDLFHSRIADQYNGTILGDGVGETKRDSDNSAARVALMRFGFCL